MVILVGWLGGWCRSLVAVGSLAGVGRHGVRGVGGVLVALVLRWLVD